MRWMSLTAALLAVPAVLSADAFLSVGFTVEGPGTCASSLSSTANTETINIGPCSPPATLGQFITARAVPFLVLVNGQPGYFPSIDIDTKVSASARWDGEFEALGGSGSAFVDFQVRTFGGAEEFDCALTILGINQPLGCNGGFGSTLSLTVPVTFGVPINYTLFVAESDRFFDSNIENANVSMQNFSVVDASGAPIPGAVISEVPEPSAIWLFGVVALAGLASISRRKQQD
jgi:hypothetical protein